jgi:hypothetical protein
MTARTSFTLWCRVEPCLAERSVVATAVVQEGAAVAEEEAAVAEEAAAVAEEAAAAVAEEEAAVAAAFR